MEQSYPIFRKSLSGKNLYRINDDHSVTELQLVGSKVYRHDLEVKIYPDKLFLKQLKACEGYEKVSREEFYEKFEKL